MATVSVIIPTFNRTDLATDAMKACFFKALYPAGGGSHNREGGWK